MIYQVNGYGLQPTYFDETINPNAKADAEAKAADEAKSDVNIEVMQVKSPEEIEAERMAMEMKSNRRTKYIDKIIEKIIDDNPQFGSSFRMASPADPEHFIRIFGQTDRQTLGEYRDHAPNMRQALMMLNGRLTHEASRVGPLEPIYAKLTGPGSNLDNEYYIVTSSPASIIAMLLCFVFAAVLIYGSGTFARWLSKGMQ